MKTKEQYPSMTILGSTGSVGEQAIDVARQTGAKVNALCANRNAVRVEEQAREFGVTIVYEQEIEYLLTPKEQHNEDEAL